MFDGNGWRVLLGSAIALAGAGCGDDPDGSPTVPDDTAASAALVVCSDLRAFANDLVRIANDAVAGISSLQSRERTDVLLEGFDAALAVAETRRSQVAALPLPDDLAHVDDLRAELRVGAVSAVEELTDERATFEREVPEVTDDDVSGRVGQFFNAFEKAMSVTEPALAGYDDESFAQAFIDEPSCRHVVQQYPVEGR
jgi:hypothetical protein